MQVIGYKIYIFIINEMYLEIIITQTLSSGMELNDNI
jgi:hypothetical protein